MRNFKDSIEKAKSAVNEADKKLKESEALSRAKETAENISSRIKENETLQSATEKINSNKYVGKAKDAIGQVSEKAKKSKHYKFIRIGAIVAVIVIIFGVGSALFGGLNDKEAKEAMKNEIVLKYDPYTGNKIINPDVKNLSIKTLDSYRATKIATKESAKVFIMDVSYIKNETSTKQIWGIYQAEDKEYSLNLMCEYEGDNAEHTRSESIKRIKNDLKKLFK